MYNHEIALVNSKILTMDEKLPSAEAVYIKNGKIVFVGRNDDVISQLRHGAKVIDLQGLTVLPGFIDSHIHLMGLALARLWVNLKGVKSIGELKEVLKRNVNERPKGSWILGRGWDHEKFEEKRYPTRLDLDEVSEEHFIVIVRVCGHLCVVNTRALELFLRESCLIENEDLAKGIIKGEMIEKLFELVPPPTLEEIRESMKEVLRELAKVGITTVHSMSVTGEEIKILEQLRSEGSLPLRVRVYVRKALLDELEKLGIQRGFGDDLLRIMGIKIIADGSLGARSAALESPYSDNPTNSGLLYISYNELVKILNKCKKSNLQPSIHAIGDRAVRLVLDAIQRAYGSQVHKHRPRLEHGSLMPRELIEKMSELKGLIISIQPSFVISDFWAVSRVGENRVKNLYPFNSLLKSGVKVTIGSDSPVEVFDPMYQLYAITTRGRYEGIETYKFTREEVVKVNEAVKMYTVNGAYATFEENSIGSISPGKCADLVVLSEDLLSVPLSDIRKVKVLATMVNGNFIHKSPEFEEIIKEYEL